MSQEAAHDVSILLRVLNEKLSLEYTRIREISPSCVVSIAELEPEVSIYQPIPTSGASGV